VTDTSQVEVETAAYYAWQCVRQERHRLHAFQPKGQLTGLRVSWAGLGLLSSEVEFHQKLSQGLGRHCGAATWAEAIMMAMVMCRCAL
jgi:hypothetical protein